MRVSLRSVGNKKSLKNNVALNCELAKKDYGWKPKINLNMGIKKTLNWYLENTN